MVTHASKPAAIMAANEKTEHAKSSRSDIYHDAALPAGEHPVAGKSRQAARRK